MASPTVVCTAKAYSRQAGRNLGEQAFEKAVALERFDLVICDVGPPNGAGPIASASSVKRTRRQICPQSR